MRLNSSSTISISILKYGRDHGSGRGAVLRGHPRRSDYDHRRALVLDVAGDRLQGGDGAGLRIGLVNRLWLGRRSGRSLMWGHFFIRLDAQQRENNESKKGKTAGLFAFCNCLTRIAAAAPLQRGLGAVSGHPGLSIAERSVFNEPGFFRFSLIVHWFISFAFAARRRRTAAVTGPPPKHFDSKTRMIGGSGSPLGYPAIRGGSFDGSPLPTHHFLDPDRGEG